MVTNPKKALFIKYAHCTVQLRPSKWFPRKINTSYIVSRTINITWVVSLSFYLFFIFLAGYSVFLDTNGFEPRELAVTSRCATNLATHPSNQLSHPHLYQLSHPSLFIFYSLIVGSPTLSDKRGGGEPNPATGGHVQGFRSILCLRLRHII